MASWTSPLDLTPGTVVTSNSWNLIFGTNGDMQYLKDIADKISYEYYYEYKFSNTTFIGGWPQGDELNVASTGTVSYGLWNFAGFPQQNRITLTGPGMYFAIMNVRVQMSTEFYTNPFLFSHVKTIITDTAGYLNFSHVSQTGYDTENDFQDYRFSIPFTINCPFDNDIMVGFVFQQNYENSYYAENNNVPAYISGTLLLYQTPVAMSEPTTSTSFILNTSILDGSSLI